MRRTQVFIIVSSSYFVFLISYFPFNTCAATAPWRRFRLKTVLYDRHEIIILKNTIIPYLRFAYLILYFIIVLEHNVMFFSKRFIVNYYVSNKTIHGNFFWKKSNFHRSNFMGIVFGYFIFLTSTNIFNFLFKIWIFFQNFFITYTNDERKFRNIIFLLIL